MIIAIFLESVNIGCVFRGIPAGYSDGILWAMNLKKALKRTCPKKMGGRENTAAVGINRVRVACSLKKNHFSANLNIF
jgi:hypothetical protein